MTTRCRCHGVKCALRRNDPRHGTENAYVNLRCRCEPCTAAHAIYMAAQKAARIARGVPNHVHGTAGGYGNYNCRCTPCSTAHAEDVRDRNARRRRGETLCAQGLMPTPKRRHTTLERKPA